MRHRVFDEKNEAAGGPMYYIERGLGKNWKPMALFFAFCGVICSFGSGNMNQANTVSLSAHTTLGAPTWITGLVMAAVVGLVILGGIRRIAAVSSRLAPTMFVLYALGALTVLVRHIGEIPDAFALILREAFNPTAGVGGTAAGVFVTTLIWGVKRGLFSNEAGQGSAPIAHAAAKTDEPAREGLVAMLGPFIDTLMICTMTGLVIVLTGSWSAHKPVEDALSSCSIHTVLATPVRGDVVADAPPLSAEFPVTEGLLTGAALSVNDGFVLDALVLDADGTPFTGMLRAESGALVGGESLRYGGKILLNSSALTTWAFQRGLGDRLGVIGKWIVTLSVFLFALSTTISWSYYG
ncbi:MAG: alanine:cation symporter family protein, partial [Gemmatimonadota bacterium]|nr:alanine:cation symporter family protein [Gemmatimonadota bacterium]